jgi:hypothetical protein
MTNVIQAIITVLGVLLLAVLVALLGGTIVWLIWPVVIPGVFPGLVGSLNPQITWWQSVCLVWLFTILFKSVSNKK